MRRRWICWTCWIRGRSIYERERIWWKNRSGISRSRVVMDTDVGGTIKRHVWPRRDTRDMPSLNVVDKNLQQAFERGGAKTGARQTLSRWGRRYAFAHSTGICCLHWPISRAQRTARAAVPRTCDSARALHPLSGTNLHRLLSRRISPTEVVRRRSRADKPETAVVEGLGDPPSGLIKYVLDTSNLASSF